MKRLLVLGVLAALVQARTASAYSLASGFTRSCHERLTLAAFTLLVEQLPPAPASGPVVLPADDLWRKVAAQLAPAVLPNASGGAAGSLSDAQRFVLASAVIGVRAPDTGGHSVSNLDELRRVQTDPDPRAQYVHTLRGPDDDGLAGNRATLAGAQQIIREEVAQAVVAAQQSGSARNTVGPVYLDFYGQLPVAVDGPAYHIARAMHTLQDAYAHTLRSADGRAVDTVLNYIDAVAGHLDERRDGMAHSDTMDDCTRGEFAPLVARATATSTALARAALALVRTGDASLLDKGFSPCAPGEPDPTTCDWMNLGADCAAAFAANDLDRVALVCCSLDNDYCGSPYQSVAREKLTRPYVKEVLSCQAAPGRARGGGESGLLVAVFTVAGAIVARRRRAGATAAALALAALVTPPAARADADEASAASPARHVFLTFEGHASLLSDIPGRSFLNATFGYGLRAGYRRGAWGLVIALERNLWLPTELSNDIEAGALNLGAGVDWIGFHGRFRASAVAGPSVLWFDAALDDKGTLGLFLDLRPAGLRWSLGHPGAGAITIVFDPLSLALVAPVLDTPGIRQVEYRTLLGLELSR